MQSSFKVIKDTAVISQGSKKIVTSFLPTQVLKRNEEVESQGTSFLNHNVMASEILEKATQQSEDIINEAYEKANIIQQEAYEQAYNSGYQDGQQQGYSIAYEEALIKGKKESEEVIRRAVNTLNNAKKEYEEYLMDKKDEVINLSINIARHILKREVNSINGIDEMIIEALENSRKAESIIIRTNSLYTDNIKARLYDWKERFALKAEVFVIADELIETGCAVIEKNNGKIRVDIDEALENIKNSIL